MQYKLLGNSGLKVSKVCMGAMTFGRETSRADSLKMLDIFTEVGGNFIDTANMYEGYARHLGSAGGVAGSGSGPTAAGSGSGWRAPWMLSAST